LWYNGGMKRELFYSVLRYISGLLIAFLIFWGFYYFIKDDNWPAVSALATVLLAIAAFLTIKSADAREDRRRQAELEREERDRKERLLNEIIQWAEGICRIIDERQLPTIDDLMGVNERKRLDAWVFKDTAEIAGLLEAMRIKGERMIIKASDNKILKDKIISLENELKEHIKSIDECKEQVRKLQKDELFERLEKLQEEFNNIKTIAINITIEASK